jgi:Fe2+ transport system protein FeoA
VNVVEGKEIELFGFRALEKHTIWIKGKAEEASIRKNELKKVKI